MKTDKERIKHEITEIIKNLFKNNPKIKYNHKQISRRLTDKYLNEKKYVTSILEKLQRENFILEAYKGKYVLNPKEQEKTKSLQNLISGVVDMKQTGKAYVITNDLTEDILINPNNTYKALHGDKVLVRLFPKRKDQKLEGEIVEITKREKTRFVGVIEKQRTYAFLIPDNKSTPVDIFIPLEQLNGAKNGQKAVAELTEWPKHAKNPFGKIIKILGSPGDNNVEIHAILEEYNLPYSFAPEVDNEAKNIDTTITSEEISSRKDLRNIFTITIDPYDAKDFDDAISLELIEKDHYRLGVHIADVSHYVKENSLLDTEAYFRGTSVYLVDRVVPMLPEKLSNNVCSLRPNEDKLTYSVLFDISIAGKVSEIWIGKTIINSNRRFTYEEVQEVIETNKGEFSEEINIFNTIASKLREKRMKNGAIAFDKKEIKFNLDENGKPISVFHKIQKESNKLIEEFMLLANRAVAEKIGKIKANSSPKTFVYRIHDIPNPEKLNSLSEFVSKLGYKLKTDTRKNISKSLNSLLKESEGKGEENLIETIAFRSMAKAEYSTQNIGHYGLAFDYYTHFTSPIRRYPDLMVHRLLNAYMNGSQSFPKEIYEEKCLHSTDREKLAQYAERDSIKFKQAEFLSDKIGKEFEGVISGVSKWGLFVELKDNKCEGMIRLKDMSDDYYYLDEENYQIIGFNSKKHYKLGDSISIRIKHVDVQRKEIDFSLS